MRKLLLILALACSFSLFGQSIDTIAMRSSIERQLTTYPESTLQDIYKSFYQEHFGPGHIISDTASARRYLMSELSEMGKTQSLTMSLRAAKVITFASISPLSPTV